MMPEPPLPPSLPQTGSVPFYVVALVTAAGGLEALSAVLRDLPSPFPAAVIVAQRLSGNGRTLAHILGRCTTLSVTLMQDGVTLAPGQVWVCPPGHHLELLLPDGTCSLSPHEGGARNRSHDCFLESLADSFGKRVMVIVLTGLGNDGAAGVRAVKQAGGVVIVQSEDTAEHPVMPRAAIESGLPTLCCRCTKSAH